MALTQTATSASDEIAIIFLHINFLGFYSFIPATLILILNLRIISRYKIRLFFLWTEYFPYDKLWKNKQKLLIFSLRRRQKDMVGKSVHKSISKKKQRDIQTQTTRYLVSQNSTIQMRCSTGGES